MRFVYVTLITILSGCATPASPCDFDAPSIPCEASIDVVNGQLVLSSPACSTVRVSFDDKAGGPISVVNVTGQVRIGTSNNGAAWIKGSCRTYPPRT